MTPDNFLKSSRSQVKQPLLKKRPFLQAIASSKILGGWQRSTGCLRVFPSCGMQLPAPDPPAARQRCGASDAERSGIAEGPVMQRGRGPRDLCRCAVPSEPPGGGTGLCCPRPDAARARCCPCPAYEALQDAAQPSTPFCGIFCFLLFTVRLTSALVYRRCQAQLLVSLLACVALPPQRVNGVY